MRIVLDVQVAPFRPVAFAASAAARAETPIATVALPCESKREMLSPTGDDVAVYCRDRTVRLTIPSGKEQLVLKAEPRIPQKVID